MAAIRMPDNDIVDLTRKLHGTAHDSFETLIRQQLRILERALPAAKQGDASRSTRPAWPLGDCASGCLWCYRVQRAARLCARSADFPELSAGPRTGCGASDPRRGGQRRRGAIDSDYETRQLLRQERQRLYADMCNQVARIDVDKLRRRAVAAVRKTHSRPTSSRDAKRVRGGAATRGPACRTTSRRDRQRRRLYCRIGCTTSASPSRNCVRARAGARDAWFARDGPYRDAERGAGPPDGCTTSKC